MKEKKYYVTEIFYSLQGEGMYVGRPSIFVRFFGCNLECQGFGMPLGELSQERKQAHNLIKTENITHLEQLPLVRTGCDSYVAWDKKFRHLSMHLTLRELVHEIIKILPRGISAHDMSACHLVVTGGEPMMHQSLINDMCALLHQENNLKYVTIETNGTLPMRQLTLHKDTAINLTFSVSLKLAESGEPLKKRYNQQALQQYLDPNHGAFNTTAILKFVVSSIESLDEVKDIITANAVHNEKVFLMPCGGCKEEYQKNTRNIAELCMEHGYNYTPRLHIDLFGNEWAT